MKHRLRFALLFVFAFGLAACDHTVEHAVDPDPAEVRGFPEQSLTIERRGGSDTLRVWVADSQERQHQGLMFVRAMPRDRGMLFPQAAPRPMTMWMKNTYLSLDIVFIGTDGTVIGIADNAQPLSEALIESQAPVSAVLELNAGEAARRGIARGDRVVVGARESR